jgi:ABC-type multidrug transport system fused ATPase/permease subunit
MSTKITLSSFFLASKIMKSRLFKVVKKITPVILSEENRPYIAGTCLLTGASIGLNFISPYIFSEAIESLYTGESTVMGIELTPTVIIFIYSTSWMLSRMTSSLKKMTVYPVVANTRKHLLAKFSNHLLQQSHRYHITASLSEKTELYNCCFLASQDYTSEMLAQIIPTSIEAASAVGILCIGYGAPIGLMLAAIIVLYSTFNIKSANRIVAAQDENLEKIIAAHTHLIGLSGNYEAIHSFNNISYELKNLSRKFSELETAVEGKYFLTEKITLMQILITSIGFMILSLYVGSNVENKKYSANDFAIVIFYLLQFFGPLSNFGDAINKARAALINLEKVYNFLELPPEVEDKFPDKKICVHPQNTSISFENVTFCYEPGIPLLDDVTLTIPAGKKTGIVGFTGAGKSTIANLLCRFYDVNSGKITINNINIKNVGLESLRSLISIVPQKPVLFNDSLLNNICYGGLSINDGITTDAEMRRVMKAACLEEFISNLPKGLNTIVGEHGKKISGGQLQRVAIARAILKKPKIYIFDEATSSLDIRTENEIQDNIDRVSKGKTTLVITHRLSTLENADNIIVLDKGKVVEQGNHNDLILKDGIYASLWKNQYRLDSEAKVEVDDSNDSFEIPDIESGEMKEPGDNLPLVGHSQHKASYSSFAWFKNKVSNISSRNYYFQRVSGGGEEDIKLDIPQFGVEEVDERPPRSCVIS